MTERIRYQGAIIRGNHILLIKKREHATGREYWMIPGGGRDGDETEETCIQREMREETCLDVTAEKLLVDEELTDSRWYTRARTWLCRIVGGEAQPGYDPEPLSAERAAIVGIGWFDLQHPENWEALVVSDYKTVRILRKVQAAMGFIRTET